VSLPARMRGGAAGGAAAPEESALSAKLNINNPAPHKAP